MNILLRPYLIGLRVSFVINLIYLQNKKSCSAKTHTHTESCCSFHVLNKCFLYSLLLAVAKFTKRKPSQNKTPDQYTVVLKMEVLGTGLVREKSC